jgi:hypothetical protein
VPIVSLRPATLADVHWLDLWDTDADVIACSSDDPDATVAATDWRMMPLALERCFADSRVTGIVIDPLESNERALRFYRRIGFRAVGRRRFGDDDCLVHELKRRDWLTVESQR